MPIKLTILTDKQYSFLRPAELFAYDNCNGFILKVFMGDGKYLPEQVFTDLDEAIAAGKNALKTVPGYPRPLLYAKAETEQGLTCVCHLPVEFRERPKTV